MIKDDNHSLPDDPAILRQMLIQQYQQIQLQIGIISDLKSQHELQLKRNDELQSAIELKAHAVQTLQDTIKSNAQKIDTLQTTVELHVQTIARQAENQRKLEHQIEQLLRRLYGRKSERFIDPGQLTLFDADDLKALCQEAVEDEQDAKKPRHKRRGHGRRPLPDHLPREVIRHEVAEPERNCPCCGEVRIEIGHDKSEQLEYTPASFKVLEHHRVKYACRKCQEQVCQAPAPPKPIEKGLPGPGLLSHVVLSKYGDHMPLYRLEDIAARSGIYLRRSTMCDWIAAAADLALPIYDRMVELVLQSKVIWTDDTTVKLVDRLLKLSKTARFWGYHGDRNHPYIVYDFTETRERDGPMRFLKGFEGYLQVDAYGGYDGIFASGKVLEVACWSHARRKWEESLTTDRARSQQVLAMVQKLYAIEHGIKDASDAERLAVRQRDSLPVLGEIRAWLDLEKPNLLPKSPSGQAATYFENQWEALNRYCESGILTIDNNTAERTLKPVAIGRKNWLFVGSKQGGRRAAILFSLVQTCKRLEVEPWAYLKDLFTRLPLLGEKPSVAEVDRLLPDNWLKEHPEHVWKINQIRREEDKKRSYCN
jgi:transposase